MPNEEITGGPMGGYLGGHNDLMLSKPVYRPDPRAAGQPLVKQHPTYGKVYHLGSAADMMEMTKRENMHRSSCRIRARRARPAIPDAIKDKAHFQHENYRALVSLGHGAGSVGAAAVRVRCLACGTT